MSASREAGTDTIWRQRAARADASSFTVLRGSFPKAPPRPSGGASPPGGDTRRPEKNPVQLRLWLVGDKTQIRIQNRHSRTVPSSSSAREEPLAPLRLLDCWRTDSLGLGCIGGTHSLPPLCPIAGTIVASNNSTLPRAFLIWDLACPSCCWKCHRTSPKLMPSR